MGKKRLGNRLIHQSGLVYKRIFPKRVHLPAQVLGLLQRVYPNLDLSVVRFFDGLPWFIDQGFAHAITLPGVYHFNRIHIYFSEVDHESHPGLAVIVHECFHALQYQELYRSRGLGLFRIFMVHYLADFFRLFFKYFSKNNLHVARRMAYEQHPMEVPAFEIDRRFQDFSAHSDRQRIFSDPIPESLVVLSTGHLYRAGHLPYWFSVLLLMILALLTPVVELLLLIFAGLCFAFGKVFSMFGV